MARIYITQSDVCIEEVRGLEADDLSMPEGTLLDMLGRFFPNRRRESYQRILYTAQHCGQYCEAGREICLKYVPPPVRNIGESYFSFELDEEKSEAECEEEPEIHFSDAEDTIEDEE